MEQKKILVTGASGFIGSFIVEEALNRGMEVWAGMRRSSSRRFLTDPRIKFLELDLDSKEQLLQALAHHHFDYVVHAAGVTKCIRQEDFIRVNTEGTRHLVEALLELKISLVRFVFISSRYALIASLPALSAAKMGAISSLYSLVAKLLPEAGSPTIIVELFNRLSSSGR